MKRAITINVNGTEHTHEVEPRLLLVHYLRDVLNLTGTRRLRDIALRRMHDQPRRAGR
jgi:aerobic-type carbon monoxide dehydrogenase small subunit (CoxS/CutS family)